jgi:glycosyltransferase involved in cell wall biosynthesis
VSVVIPVYNGERFLSAAIESVQAQRLSVSEIIVVDDGSTDRSAEIAGELGVTVIRQNNQGLSAARNAGIRAARNEWIAFNDHDDLWEAEKIADQMKAAEQYPRAAVITCHMRWFADETVREQMTEFQTDDGLGEHTDGTITYLERVEDYLPLSRMIDFMPSALIRKDALVAAGMFNEELRLNEDLECFLRVVARSPLAIIRKVLVHHRMHDTNSVFRDPEETALAYEKVLNWMRLYPERYPRGAARIYGKSWARRQMSAGRALLQNGERTEARAILAQSLARSFSFRALFLWGLSFVSPAMFTYLLSLKQRLKYR